MTPDSRTAVTGARGFIGSAVVRASDETLRLLLRAPHLSTPQPHSVVVGDIQDRDAVAVLLEGVKTVIHCANYIGPDEERARNVNDEGTRRLVDAAVRAGVERILYVSTTGVYGTEARALAAEHTPVDPRSFTSATRLRAEGHVLSAGGVVVRPHLVFGLGDRRVLPALVRAVDVMGGLPRPEPATSVISVRSLAAQVWWIVRRPGLVGVVHPDHGDPVALGDILRMTGLWSHREGGEAVCDPATAARLLADAGFSAHQREMILHDSVFRSRIAAQQPPRFPFDEADVAWYRELLGTSARGSESFREGGAPVPGVLPGSRAGRTG